MNFERMNDKIIGERVKRYRKSLGLTQEKFCDTFDEKVSIDKFRLSAIESGKRDKRKNPHFLTNNYIDFFSEQIGISTKELLFGDKQERINIVKLVLLSLFMNGTKKMANTKVIPREINPIFDPLQEDKELFRLAMMNLIDGNDEERLLGGVASKEYLGITSPIPKVEGRIRITKKLEEIDNFFFGKNFARYYDLLMDGRQLFPEQSSVLLKSLFGNFDFASDFLDRCDSLENYSYEGWELRNTDLEIFYIDNYLDGKGNFAAAAIDWKELSYRKFINAFNEFLNLHLEKFYDFFESNIFSKSIKALSNAYVNEVFGSSNFINLTKDILEADQFIPSRMTGHNFARAEIQKLFLIKKDSEDLLRDNATLPSKRRFDDYYDLSKKEKSNREYDLSKYLYDFENLTYVFAHSKREEENLELGLHAPTYFAVKSL